MSEFEGQQPQVDNPIQPSPEPAPEPAPDMSANPDQPMEPQQQTIDPRSPEALQALLDGADPKVLFGEQAESQAELELPLEPGQQEEQTAEPPQPTEPQLEVPDKFKNQDGTLNQEALLKSYIGLEKKLGEQGQQLGQMSQLQQQLQQLQGYIQQQAQMQWAAAQQPQPQEQQPETPKFPWEVEMSEEEKQKAIEEYYEDPLAAQAKRDQQTMQAMEYKFQQKLQEALEPLTPVVQQYQYQQEVLGFQQQIQEFMQDEQHSDFAEYVPQMKEILQKHGAALKQLPNAVEVVYNWAKGMNPPQAPQPSVDELLQSPEVKQKLLNDESLKNEIIKGYMTQVRQGQPPATIGSQPGGTPVATPGEKIRSVREASSAFRRALQRSQ